MTSVVRFDWAKNAPPEVREARIAEIRAIALAVLAGEDVSINAWAYYGELQDDLRPDVLTVPFLEALSAVCVIGKLRPSRATGAIRSLRHMRISAGEEDRFLAFEARLKSYLGDGGISNHGVGTKMLASLNHESIWNQIRSNIAVLNKAGYEVFLNSGTLLGVTRDGKLIDHDDDVDLALILKADNPADAAEEWKSLGALLDENGIRDLNAKKNPAIYKLKSAEGCDIDLFPAWIQDDCFFIYPHTRGQLARSDVLPLAQCRISKQAIPSDPEKMLAINYGEKWRKPDPYFKFDWLKARRKFRPFLEGLR